MEEVYFTPQHKIDAQLVGRKQYVKQEVSEYIYESNEDSNATPGHNIHTNGDEYVLPAQDREDTPEIRPQKEKKGNVQDIYDEDHYTLARNSGFDQDFSTSVLKNSKVVDHQSKHRVLNKSHMIVFCVILVLFAIGGIIAYVMIDRIGKPFIGFYTYDFMIFNFII